MLTKTTLSIFLLSPGLFPTDSEVCSLATSLDTDGSGQIELQELIQGMGRQVRPALSLSSDVNQFLISMDRLCGSPFDL